MTPYKFTVGRETAYDWGHYLRATGRHWTWIHRALAWNPCNVIGHLYAFNIDE